MNLYSTHAKKFSNTRQAPWKGWESIVKYIDSEKELKILDIGCGNGRFLKFLKAENKFSIKNYTGVDYSEEMLALAGQNISNYEKELDIELIKSDVNKQNWEKDITGEFNLIVAFGLMHHIESKETRSNFVKQIYKNLSQNGILVLSFWMFAENEKFLESHRLREKEQELGVIAPNDYILKFGNTGAFRFCHHYEEEEIDKLYGNTNLNEVTRFREDGKDERMNLYVVNSRLSL